MCLYARRCRASKLTLQKVFNDINKVMRPYFNGFNEGNTLGNAAVLAFDIIKENDVRAARWGI